MRSSCCDPVGCSLVGSFSGVGMETIVSHEGPEKAIGEIAEPVLVPNEKVQIRVHARVRRAPKYGDFLSWTTSLATRDLLIISNLEKIA